MLGLVAGTMLLASGSSVEAARHHRTYYYRSASRQPLTNFNEWWGSITSWHRGNVFKP
jgi:hypothetical protein